MKVLVTGIAGFLGSWVSEALVENGHDVVGIDNLSDGYIDNVPKEAKFFRGDAADLKLMTKITRGVDAIYHFAASPYECLSVFAPHMIAHDTYMTSVGVCVAAARNNIGRVIFTSSIARYGENKIPFTEDMPPNPKDPYGIDKVASEWMLGVTKEVYGVDYVIAIPHNIIGPRQRYDDPYRNVVSIFINRMLRGKQPVIYGDGKQKRTFSAVKDCVNPLLKMLKSRRCVGEAINIGPGPEDNYITVNRVAEIIAEKLDFDLRPIYVPERPEEVKYVTSSNEKARKMLKYRPKEDICDTIDDMIAYIKRRGTKPFRYNIKLEIINEKTPKTWRKKLI